MGTCALWCTFPPVKVKALRLLRLADAIQRLAKARNGQRICWYQCPRIWCANTSGHGLSAHSSLEIGADDQPFCPTPYPYHPSPRNTLFASKDSNAREDVGLRQYICLFVIPVMALDICIHTWRFGCCSAMSRLRNCGC